MRAPWVLGRVLFDAEIHALDGEGCPPAGSDLRTRTLKCLFLERDRIRPELAFGHRDAAGRADQCFQTYLAAFGDAKPEPCFGIPARPGPSRGRGAPQPPSARPASPTVQQQGRETEATLPDRND